MYLSRGPEQGSEHGISVLQIVEQRIWGMGCQLLGCEVARGDGHRPNTASASAGDIAGRVADDHDVVGWNGLAELLLEALSGNRHQAGAIAMVGAKGADGPVDVIM
jgi:hypothetical protein